MSFLNLDNLVRSICIMDQHAFSLTTHLLTKKAQMELTAAYPTQGFIPSQRTSGDKKHYIFEILPVIEQNQLLPAFANLTELWQCFIQSIIDPSYIQCVFSLVDQQVSAYKINMGFYRFGHGAYVSPHVDNPGKYFTQLFYFNHTWDVMNWGGQLHLLASNDPDQIILSIPPLVMYTTTIFRQTNSWHSVEIINALAKSYRLTLQLEVVEK